MDLWLRVFAVQLFFYFFDGGKLDSMKIITLSMEKYIGPLEGRTLVILSFLRMNRD